MEIKTQLHPKNINRAPYDLKALEKIEPGLSQFIDINEHGNLSVNYAEPKAVKLLNKALLAHYYGITFWEFPDNYLCPAVPGRADYLHYVADLIGFEKEKKEQPVRCLDIGTGASLIYPIIGIRAYNWSFVATDIDPETIKICREIVRQNACLAGKVDCVLQANKRVFFEGIINENDKFDVTICNPPFYASEVQAQESSYRKNNNLGKGMQGSADRNFSGKYNELVYEGGEYNFIQAMIYESKKFGKNVKWFTSLVSNYHNLEGLNKKLVSCDALCVKVIPMHTGNKSTRILAWSFLNEQELEEWWCV